MAKTVDYEKRAQECSLKAATAANDQARDVWRKMEADWLKLASAKNGTSRFAKTPSTKTSS